MPESRAVTFSLPLRLVSEANSHTHWRTRQKRAKEHIRIAQLFANRAVASTGWVTRKPCSIFPTLEFPLKVTITRVAPRALDSDNLVGAPKHVRDGIAKALGIDDRDPRVTWCYDQRRGKPREYAAEVRIERQ